MKLVAELLKCVSLASLLWFCQVRMDSPVFLCWLMPCQRSICVWKKNKTKQNNENHNSSKELHELGLIQLLSLASSGGVHGGSSEDNSSAVSACPEFSWDFRLSSEWTPVIFMEENHLWSLVIFLWVCPSPCLKTTWDWVLMACWAEIWQVGGPL